MPRMMKAHWLGLALAIAAIAVITARYGYERIEFAALFYPVTGLDISHHQGAIDWPALRKSGAAFAYIKATEGGNYRDPRFQQNWQGSRDAGLRRGAYHFFTLCKSGAEQAANFIATVPVDADALPHAVDVEHLGPCSGGSAMSNVPAEIESFLDRVEAQYGRRPVVYTTREFHDTHLSGRLLAERFWLRSLVVPPRFRQSQWVLWQYHNRGRRTGVAGPLDLNAFAGSQADFERFAAGALSGKVGTGFP
jgi:lysozyme